MAFDNSFTAVTGATYTAAQYNTHTRDNFTAIWVYTTAGDIAYATSSTTLARREIGSEHTFLKSNGSIPIWGTLDFASVYHNTSQNIPSGSVTTLAFNSEVTDAPGWHSTTSNTSRITVSATGYYMVSAWFIYTTGGGSGTYNDYVSINRSGSAVGTSRELQEKDANGKHFLVTIPIIGASAGAYFEVTLEQNSGETASVAANARFSVLRLS